MVLMLNLEVQTKIRDEISSWLAFVLKFLPCELPSRKKDSEGIFVLRSIPYVTTGAVAFAIASGISPGLRQLPSVWIGNLVSLSGVFQKLICSLLSLISFWFGAFALGVLIIEKSRPFYRQYLVRPIERKLDFKP